MMKNQEVRTLAVTSDRAASAHETGILSTNRLRRRNAQGTVHHRPSDTRRLRALFADMLTAEHTGIAKVKVYDLGQSFAARVRMDSGRKVFRRAYNLRNLYGLVSEGILAVS